MSHFRRKRRKSNTKNVWGFVLIGVAILILTGIFAAAGHLQSQRPPVDPVTLCPLNGSPKYVAIVFDKTDTFNPIQRQFLNRFFQRIKLEWPTGTRVSLFVIDPVKPERIDPELVVCNPGTGDDASFWTANPKALKNRWASRFEKPLDNAIQNFLRPEKADHSPIFEILQIVALTAFPNGSEQAEKSIILVSDMLHHTPEWSHYRGEFELATLLDSDYYQKVRTNLHSSEVQILYVRRDGATQLQTKRHAYFWADYIHSINGRVTLIEKIDG